jgi:hypothetical protein
MTYKPGTVILHSRRYVDPLNMAIEDIDIHDISHALAMKCRYGGHCPKFYSVAQHSVQVSNWLTPQPLITQLAGLLHDGAEAYTPDILGPTRKARVYEGIRGLQDEIDELIIRKFIEPFCPRAYDVGWDWVRTADTDLLKSECISLWGCIPVDWGLTAPIDYQQINPLRPYDAKLLFEERFWFLMRGLETEREQKEAK